MTADVIIIGAGVIGAATALQLSMLGVRDVLVVDRATVGSGMSCRSSALVRMHYTFPSEVELAVRSDGMFRAWPELTGQAVLHPPHWIRPDRGAGRGERAPREPGNAARARRARRSY